MALSSHTPPQASSTISEVQTERYGSRHGCPNQAWAISSPEEPLLVLDLNNLEAPRDVWSHLLLLTSQAFLFDLWRNHHKGSEGRTNGSPGPMWSPGLGLPTFGLDKLFLDQASYPQNRKLLSNLYNNRIAPFPPDRLHISHGHMYILQDTPVLAWTSSVSLETHLPALDVHVAG